MGIPRSEVQRLLACDLDGTLIYDGSGHPDSPPGLLWLSDFCKSHGAGLVYITGRSRLHARYGIDSWGLPEPDWLATSCGTELYYGESPDDSFAVRAGGWNPGRVVVALSKLRLEPQCACLQTPFKMSYYGESAEDARQALLNAGIQANVLLNRDRETGRSQIDVIPRTMGKVAVLHHLQAGIGLEVQDIVFAGNGGNDLAVFDSDYQSVVVGNSELRSVPERVYRAVGHYADGVLEGAAHWWR
jgi:hydroxymethylpyrimidine pyrophosphatase-like HAD family hydrolase